jgi:hypothetical protein
MSEGEERAVLTGLERVDGSVRTTILGVHVNRGSGKEERKWATKVQHQPHVMHDTTRVDLGQVSVQNLGDS